MMSSKLTGALASGSRRMPGKHWTAQASEAQAQRIARFSCFVRSGSLSTSRGWLKTAAGVKYVVEIEFYPSHQSLLCSFL